MSSLNGTGIASRNEGKGKCHLSFQVNDEERCFLEPERNDESGDSGRSRERRDDGGGRSGPSQAEQTTRLPSESEDPGKECGQNPGKTSLSVLFSYEIRTPRILPMYSPSPSTTGSSSPRISVASTKQPLDSLFSCGDSISPAFRTQYASRSPE